MVECDLCAALEYEARLRGFLWLCAYQREQSHGRVPETAVREDLCIIAAEDNRVEARIIAVSALFQEEGVCLALLTTARGSTIHDDVCRITQELLLLWLRTNNHGIAPFQFAYFLKTMLKLSSLLKNMQSILAFF